MRNSKNVPYYLFGRGSFGELASLLSERRVARGHVLFFVDKYFKTEPSLRERIPLGERDRIVFVETQEEPKTDYIDNIMRQFKGTENPCAIVGIGGGISLDVAKACGNLFTNPGSAALYQGWDLVKHPAVYKIGIPTLSGTGAESSRTCVLTNPETNAKLGMNSHYTVFDQLILDPDLTETVPRDQYFYTGMDAYIHCAESLAGQYRNAIADALSREARALCVEVFESETMQANVNREKMMVASYLGGCAIGNSYVGVVHPFSAGLSVAFGIHHGLANCLVLNVMEEFYPEETAWFHQVADRQRIELPKGICHDLDDQVHRKLYEATTIHEIPLKNALGEDFRKILTRDKVREIFERI